MAYSSASFVEAGRPWPLQIGAVTVTPRPVSVVVALRVDAALRRGDVVSRAHAFLDLMAAAFPAPPWRTPIARLRHWWQAPGARIKAIPDEAVRRRVIAALLTGPAKKAEPEKPQTIEEQVIARHRAIASRAAGGHAPSLAVIVATLRAALGDGWYWNPARYGTTDGYVPVRQVLVDYAGHHAVQSAAMLREATAARLAQADAREWRRATDTLSRASAPEAS